MLLFITVKL